MRARVIVNATGPWADHIRRLERADADNRLALSKGVHLVVSRQRLPINHTVTMTAPDKRGVFVVPRDDVAYLGTTDTFYPDSAYSPEITGADVDYLLASANRVFRTPALTRDDVIALWSGIRPLIAEPGNKAPSELSRRDEVMDGPAGIITIAGGKLTAYRRMAERIADLCCKRLGRNGVPSTTADEPLPGGALTESLSVADATTDRNRHRTTRGRSPADVVRRRCRDAHRWRRGRSAPRSTQRRRTDARGLLGPPQRSGPLRSGRRRRRAATGRRCDGAAARLVSRGVRASDRDLPRDPRC